MAVIRRHPGAFLLIGALVLACGLVFTLLPRPTAHAEAAGSDGVPAAPAYTPLDAVARGEIDTLRSTAGLTDDVLTCLNLTEDQLETVLAATRTWYLSNRASWNQSRQRLAHQQALVRRARAALDTNSGGPSALLAAQNELPALAAAVDTQLATLRGTALRVLSESQRSLFERMRVAVDLPMPYRVLALTNEQRSALLAEESRFSQRLGVARDAQSRAALVTAHQAQVASMLGGAGTQDLAALAQYRSVAAARLVAMLNRVFPEVLSA